MSPLKDRLHPLPPSLPINKLRLLHAKVMPTFTVSIGRQTLHQNYSMLTPQDE